MGILRMVCFTERAFTYGPMELNTSVSFISTRSMVEVLMNGEIRENLKEPGIEGSDRAKECIHSRTVTRGQVYGGQTKE